MAGVAAFSARAELQFDVFLGFDGIVPEANWFPVVANSRTTGRRSRASSRFPPACTIKVRPAGCCGIAHRNHEAIGGPRFSSTRYVNNWEARLLDERGKVRAQQINLQARKKMSWESPLLGALPAPQVERRCSSRFCPSNPNGNPSPRAATSIFPETRSCSTGCTRST